MRVGRVPAWRAAAGDSHAQSQVVSDRRETAAGQVLTCLPDPAAHAARRQPRCAPAERHRVDGRPRPTCQRTYCATAGMLAMRSELAFTHFRNSRCQSDAAIFQLCTFCLVLISVVYVPD